MQGYSGQIQVCPTNFVDGNTVHEQNNYTEPKFLTAGEEISGSSSRPDWLFAASSYFSYVSIFAGRKVEYLPTTEVFSQALYTLDIGQNDFTSKLGQIGIEGVKQFLPQVASQIG